MNIEVVEILDKGIANKERIVLRVLGFTNLSYYALAHTRLISTNSISNDIKNTYWFNPLEVSPGDYIIVFTKKGIISSVQNTEGTKTHWRYWGFKNTVFTTPNDCAVLFEINTWMTKS